MDPIDTVGQVFEAIQQAKAGTADFCTNFFPVQRRLQDWIKHEELFRDIRGSTVFFFRKDRDFWHLYFCAPAQPALEGAVASLPELKTERVVLDLVGNEDGLGGLRVLWEAVGFRCYTRLCRMARTKLPDPAEPANGAPPAEYAGQADCRAILELLEQSFDRYGEQLPMLYEVEAAVAGRQILVARHEAGIAGLLFFETQGFSSTLRFWAVAPQFQSLGMGSALMRQYLASQKAVRRFVLWVATDNVEAVRKYGHYGYVLDGLVDYVLVNNMVPA